MEMTYFKIHRELVQCLPYKHKDQIENIKNKMKHKNNDNSDDYDDDESLSEEYDYEQAKNEILKRLEF